jgi:hypothetical protein
MPAGSSHVAFSAPSRAVVREFYACALRAGGMRHGSPAARNSGEHCFNAAVLDFDGNSIEVIFHEDNPHVLLSANGNSRVLTWREKVGSQADDAKSVMSARTIQSVAQSAARKSLGAAASPSAIGTAKARSVAGSVRAPSFAGSKAPSAAGSVKARSVAGSVKPPTELSAQSVLATLQQSIMGATGSKLLDSKIEMSPKTLAGTLLGAAAGAAVAYAMCKSEEDSARAEHEAYLASKRSSRVIELDPNRLVPGLRALPPAPSHYSDASRRSAVRAIEGAPAPLMSHVPSNAGFLPDPVVALTAMESAHSRAHRADSRVSSSSRTRVASVHGEDVEADARSVHSSRSHKSHRSHSSHHSKAKSSTSKHTSSSKRRGSGHHHSRSSHALPSVPEDRVTSEESDYPPPEDYVAYVEDNSDLDTVAPSDSISCAGSSRSKRSKRSKTKGSKSSSRTGLKSSSNHKVKTLKPLSMSEAGSVKTITPRGYFAGQGSMVTLPIRTITPSMIYDGRKAASFYA